MASNFGRCEPRLAPLNDVKHELPHHLNLMQLAKHEKLGKRKTCPWLGFGHITKLWHQRLGANAQGVGVELVVDHDPNFLHEGV
jgi:hypothetical protein